MSDGSTDIARDHRRNKLYVVYIERFADFLENPTSKAAENVMKAAEEMDSVKRGYWDGPSHIATNLKCHLHDLTNVFLEIERRK